jgi:methyl-accepting chemotaxis protein
MFKNKKILHRIALSALLPLVAFAALAVYEISGKWTMLSEFTRIQPVVDGSSRLGRLVHELQRERGMTSVFLGSNGAQMRAELGEQRKRTDAERAYALSVLGDLARQADSEFVSAALAAAETANGLDRQRDEIDRQAIAPAAAIGYFTETVGKLVAVVTGISRLSTDDDISKLITAYANLVEGKERAGLERAAVAAGIASGRFEPQAYVRAIGLAAAQESFFSSFRAIAAPKAKEFFAATLSGPGIEKFDAMRKLVEQGGLAGDFKSLDSKTWFDAATVRIDLLKAVEDRLVTDLADLTASKKEGALLSLGAVAGLALFALLLSSLTVIAMARSVTVPLGALGTTMTRLANGELSVEIESADRGDEIGVMARAVQFFKENLSRTTELAARERETVSQNATRAARVGELTGQFDKDIGDIIQSVISASSQLEATAGLMSRTANKTSDEAASVANATTAASGNMQSVAAATEELSTSVAEIGRQVMESAAIAQKAAAEGRRTNETVQGLSEAAEKIGDVVKLISEIASQTNLLALNATIEAARAGDAGRGFAVVAAEVKGLAGQTAKATDEIRGQIAAIQATSTEAVRAIQGITATVGAVNEITATIASAVEEQSAATQEIARSVQHATQGTSDISNSVLDVKDTAAETGAAASRVLSASEELSRQSAKMRQYVDRFIGGIKAA